MFHEIPIGRGQIDVRAVVVLEMRRPAKMVYVAVAEDNRLDDLRRIQVQLL